MNASLRVVLFLVFLLLAGVILFGLVFGDKRPAIYFAAESGDTNAIARYLALGSNVNANIACYPFAERVLRAPLLYVAIEKGQFHTVAFLLENGADPNQPDGRGETPLMWAAQPEILELLLKKGADPNKHGLGYLNTPLIEAAAYGTTQTVSLLLAAGAAVNATNLNGATAFHRARTPEIAQMLLTAGADPNLRDTQGETPMDIAARRGYTNVLAALSNETLRATNRIRR